MSDITAADGTAVQPHTDVQVRTGLPIHYVGIEATVNPIEIGPTLGEILPKIWQHLTERGIAPVAPPFSLYHSYTADETRLEGGVPILEPIEVEAPYICRTLNPKQVAAAWNIGPFSTLPGTYGRITEWAAANGYQLDGAPWEVYWSDPAETPAEELRTEVLWPVIRATS